MHNFILNNVVPIILTGRNQVKMLLIRDVYKQHAFGFVFGFGFMTGKVCILFTLR